MKNFFLFLAIFLAIPASSLAFSDVPTTHRFAEEIKFVQEKGIVGGYADGTFKPENTINRAEFTKIIISALYTKEEIDACDTSKFSFPDVSKSEWYAKFVCKAKEKGVINGYSTGNFLPEGPVSISESLKIILLAYKIDLTTSITVYGNEEFWSAAYVNKGIELFPKMEKLQEKCVNDETCYPVPAQMLSRGEMAYFIQKLSQK